MGTVVRSFPNACLIIASLALSACAGDPLERIPDTGTVSGYLCDGDHLASNVVVTAPGLHGDVSATTDVAGYFVLSGVLAGSRELSLSTGERVRVEIPAEGAVELDPPPCLASGIGAITGQICGVESSVGGDTYWLEGARVYVEVGGQVYEALTGTEGHFTLTGVPAGPRELRIEKGAYHASVNVVVPPGATATVEPVCIGEKAEIAVVTGMYDLMEKQLFALGMKSRRCLPADLDSCPNNLDDNGTVTLVDGSNGTYITDMLMQPDVMESLDIIFFNCGLADVYLASSSETARQSLRDFVAGGGSIFVSDWAYEIIRWAFPDALDFYGDDDAAGQARVGDAASIEASVTDPRLAASVGSSEVELSYNKGSWVVLSPTQPEGVEKWVVGDIGLSSDSGSVTQSHTPLLVSVPYGEGRIFFTTFHSHEQTTSDMPMVRVLRHMVFEL